MSSMLAASSRRAMTYSVRGRTPRRHLRKRSGVVPRRSAISPHDSPDASLNRSNRRGKSNGNVGAVRSVCAGASSDHPPAFAAGLGVSEERLNASWDREG